MKSINLKSLFPHITALLFFIALSIVYFYPLLEGYKLKQGDIEKHKAMAHEIKSHQEKYGNRILWSGNMFAGMPSYLTSTVKFDGNIARFINAVYHLWLPHPASTLFAYFLGFYILLLCLRVNPWLSIIGAIAFAFSSYFIIIIEAGHTSKANAIAYMAPILGGFLMTLRGRVKVGMLLIAIFTAGQLYVNHLQITYYLFFILLFVGVAYLIKAVKENALSSFMKRVGFVFLGALLGLLPNLGNLLVTFEYAKESTRSKSELTLDETGKSRANNASSGLDKSYITQWSYGIDETWTLLVPNAKGGSSYPILGNPDEVDRLRKEDPKFFNYLVSEYQNKGNAIGNYFGNQPIVSGPVYIGVVVVFLALLAMLLLNSPLVYALGAVSVFSIMLAWGNNFMGLTEFFIDYVPGYNKFRAVAMILLIAELTLPLMAILFLQKVIEDKGFLKENIKKFYVVSGIFVVALAIFYLSPDSLIDLTSEKEQNQFQQSLLAAPNQQNALYTAQETLLDYRTEKVSDSALSSLKYLIIAILLLYLLQLERINQRLFLLGMGGVVFIDLWLLDKQYLNNKENPNSTGKNEKYISWIKPEKFKIPYDPTTADRQILAIESGNNASIKQGIDNRINTLKKENRGRVDQRKIIDIQYSELMEHTHYRVFNVNARMDQDVRTPYFHKTLGGYHGAKLKKYQEMVDFYLAREHFQLRQAYVQGGVELVRRYLPQMKVSNMLNAKYVVGPDKSGKVDELVTNNPYAMGNAWFVDNVKVAENADSAILAVGKIDPQKSLVVIKEDATQLEGIQLGNTQGSTIQLTNYHPDKLTYTYKSNAEGVAVFSEVYYEGGWKAYINGIETPFFRANYIMRAMKVPAGSGEIVFEFKPATHSIGSTISWASSIIMVLLTAFVGYGQWKQKQAEA